MKNNHDLRLAVLIDGDNISSSKAKEMLNEIAKFGIPTIKRIYGDWTSDKLTGWKKVLLDTAITPIQQYAYTTGKNATDSAMIIDAMDILHSGRVGGFCIVSSDSDFTRLATRLRESGMFVIGIGEKKTPNPFIASCDKFVYLEIIGLVDNQSTRGNIQEPLNMNLPATKETIGKDIIKLIKSTINDISDDNGWAYLGEVGSLIMKKKPDFDPRNYGYTKMTPFIKSLKTDFEIEERDAIKTRIKLVYIRNKT
ncbi:MAG: NYN domain-containing protein [Treponemataceae bacterium]